MQQSRQEEQKGITPILLAVSLAAVLIGAMVGSRYATQSKNLSNSPSPTITPSQISPRTLTIQVVNKRNNQPIPRAMLVFTTTIYCIQVVGVECPQPTPVVITTDENGIATFQGEFPGEKVSAKADGYKESEEIELYQFDQEIGTLSTKEEVVIGLEKI